MNNFRSFGKVINGNKDNFQPGEQTPPGVHFVMGPVLFPAVSSRKRPAQALRWLSITKTSSGIHLTRFNDCASEDKANNSLLKSTNPTAPPS